MRIHLSGASLDAPRPVKINERLLPRIDSCQSSCFHSTMLRKRVLNSERRTISQMLPSSRAKWKVLAGFSLATAGILLALLEMRAPTVDVVQDGNQILVHLRQFGQFSPRVSRIRLTSQPSNTVVVDLRGHNGTPRLYFFSLKEGINTLSEINANADYAVYRADVPRENKSFELQRGRTYILSIWGRFPWGRHTDTTIRIQ